MTWALPDTDDVCVCGHPRHRHVDSIGACADPTGPACTCAARCRSYVADHAANAARAARRAESQRQHGRIDRARAYMDAGWDGRGWRPSELLTAGYCILATSERPELAAPFVDEALADARAQYRTGLPWRPQFALLESN